MSLPSLRTLVYDGSFAGWLCAVFECYEYKFNDVSILPETRGQHNLFGETHRVHTDEQKALRVWKGLQQRVSRNATTALYRAFLSEERGMEDRLLQYAQYAFSKRLSVENDYSHPAVLYVVSTAKKVHREKHRMEAFVRFQQTKDNLYYAVIDPDFNVLPLIQPHFQRRYADQRWMIYDIRRKTGLYYDLESTQTVEMVFSDRSGGIDPSSGSMGPNHGVDADPGLAHHQSSSVTDLPPSPSVPRFRPAHEILDDKEDLYRQLWQHYFDSVNIAARKNMKLHIRHMPTRYWKYLPEKHPRPQR